ncbi:gluconolactonase [Alphaproteobacteria bacterium]|nr:gluconolactonase [Alphaproteobacteria bacterium]
MKKGLFFLGLFLLGVCLSAYGQTASGIIAPGAKVEQLADGFKFTEGPAVDSKGNVYFTDQPNDKIYKWSVDGKLSEFGDKQGRANGMYFDKEGFLLSCSDDKNELWSIDTSNGSHTVILADIGGERLNGPNDLWVTPNGSIYFTDPYFKRAWWTDRPEGVLQGGQFLYYITPDRKSVRKVDTDLKQPNGLIGTPDGKRLYVADPGVRKTYVYTIQPDGSLTDRKLFAETGSDGMTIDNKGNIYVTGRGVTVFNPAGEQIEQIPVQAGWTANVCFGGEDLQTLFITASEKLYSIRMSVKGVR